MQAPQKMQALVTVVDGKDINDDSNLNEVLKTQEIDIPELKGWETLVEVRYVSLGPADVACLRAQQKRTTPGFDVAGIVAKDKSGSFKQGDRVFGIVHGGLVGTITNGVSTHPFRNNGSFATYAIVHSDLLLRIPNKESFASFAALPFCTLAAYQALSETFENWPAKDKNHEPILIAGGSSSVGLSAIQLARRMGYRVITTTSPKHFNLCQQFGADRCFDFKDDNLVEKIKEDSQDSLSFAIDTINQGYSLSIAYKSIGFSGGEVITLVPRYQNEMEKQRSEVMIKARLPTTIWGTEAIWQGKIFSPSHHEHQNVKAFLRDFSAWLHEGSYKVLPVQLEEERGLKGVLGAMERVRVHHPSGVRVVVCVKEE